MIQSAFLKRVTNSKTTVILIAYFRRAWLCKHIRVAFLSVFGHSTFWNTSRSLTICMNESSVRITILQQHGLCPFREVIQPLFTLTSLSSLPRHKSTPSGIKSFHRQVHVTWYVTGVLKFSKTRLDHVQLFFGLQFISNTTLLILHVTRGRNCQWFPLAPRITMPWCSPLTPAVATVKFWPSICRCLPVIETLTVIRQKMIQSILREFSRFHHAASSHVTCGRSYISLQAYTRCSTMYMRHETKLHGESGWILWECFESSFVLLLLGPLVQRKAGDHHSYRCCIG